MNKTIEFVRNNLGKEVEFDNSVYNGKGLIVGYRRIAYQCYSIIIGRTDNLGWTEIDEADTLLIFSPMIKSYNNVLIEHIFFI